MQELSREYDLALGGSSEKTSISVSLEDGLLRHGECYPVERGAFFHLLVGLARVQLVIQLADLILGGTAHRGERARLLRWNSFVPPKMFSPAPPYKKCVKKLKDETN